jgi:hypothetical protein
MTVQDSTLMEAVVQGLTAPVTTAEFEEAVKPPYRVPAALVASRERLISELVARLPATGDGPLTVRRILETPPQPYRDVVHLLCIPGNFEFADAACALVAVSALDSPDVEALMPLLESWCGIRRQQVLNCLAVGDFGGAREAADRILDDMAWAGHRDIAAVLADRGDAVGFFAGWKRYSAGQYRYRMVELKTKLVGGVAHADGWQAALAVARDQRIGPKFAKYAFSAFAADVEGLCRVFAGEAAGVLSELDELTMLAQALQDATGTHPERNHPLLDEIVDRIIAVDPTTDKATMRTRDGLLFSLWPAIGEQTTLDRVRKAVRTPRFRSELMTLSHDSATRLHPTTAGHSHHAPQS